MNVGRFIIRISLFILIPLLIALVTYRFLDRAFLAPLDHTKKNAVLVEITEGRTIKSLSQELQQRSVLRHWWTLWFLATISDKANKIQACEYQVSAAMTPKEILRKLTSGDVFKHTVSLKEGETISDIAKAVERAELISASEFLRGARDRALLATANMKSDSFEGYLFPDTYYFCRPATVKDIIWRMLKEGDKHWPPAFTEQADKLNLSRQEILTMASMIEKESSNYEEQPLIASVLHNRLAKGMKLQSDPTVIYGMENFDGNLRPEDRDMLHPYNTYVNYGLPPGPISNPGDTAIRAALFPKETTYLYFVAKGDGNHVFSTTYQEQLVAVELYQPGRAAGMPPPEVIATPAPIAPPTPMPTPAISGKATYSISPKQRR